MTAHPPEGLSVASLNLAMEKDAGKILSDLAKAPEVRDADLLLFQEVVHTQSARSGVAGQVARALNRQVAFAPEAPNVYDRGLAIVSRYPIRDVRVRTLKAFNLRFHNRSRFALAAVVDAPAGPVRVWNVHLDTRINARDRIDQLSGVVADAAASNGPQIVAGDFNTNSFYWLWNALPIPWSQSQGEAVRRFMAEHGFNAPLQSLGPTFEHLGMHLDWIYEKGLAARAAAVHRMPFSDHRALLVQFAANGRIAGPAREAR